jgi:2-polyprenyl-3-methyl-5-hydroxy-6-metoxy-1,4-benzoquinol methylase
MQRIPEPELMTDEEQVIAYANADFDEPHNHFIELLKESVGDELPESGIAVDLGCGAADISIRFARAFPDYRIEGIDASAAMLAEGRKVISGAGLEQRISLNQTYLQELTLAHKDYSIIICNAMLHHLHDPMVLWNLIKTATNSPMIFIMDLMRPESDAQIYALVEEYASNEPLILKRDFRNSLRAAFTPDEVVSQLSSAGLNELNVSVVSDRHIAVSS